MIATLTSIIGIVIFPIVIGYIFGFDDVAPLVDPDDYPWVE